MNWTKVRMYYTAYCIVYLGAEKNKINVRKNTCKYACTSTYNYILGSHILMILEIVSRLFSVLKENVDL